MNNRPINIRVMGLEKQFYEPITTGKILDGAVTTPKIADSAITNDKLAEDSVDTSQLKNNSVTTEKIADSAVTNPKIADAAVGSSKIADRSVTYLKLADNAVITEKIKDGSITRNKLGSDFSFLGLRTIADTELDSTFSSGVYAVTSDDSQNMLLVSIKRDLALMVDEVCQIYIKSPSGQIMRRTAQVISGNPQWSEWEAVGETDLSEYIKNTDYATESNFGVVKIGTGIKSVDGVIETDVASETLIMGRNPSGFINEVITPSNLNFAVKSALSDNNRISDMTDEEKANARGVIGALGASVLNDYYTKSQVDTKLSSVYKYKGTVQTSVLLPSSAENGDVYNVVSGSTTLKSDETSIGGILKSINIDNLNNTVSLTLSGVSIGNTNLLVDVGFAIKIPENYGGGTVALAGAYQSYSNNVLTLKKIDCDIVSVNCFDGNFTMLCSMMGGSSALNFDIDTIYFAHETSNNFNDGANVAWSLGTWDELGTTVDISAKADKSDTLSGYGITDAYTKTEIDGKIASVYKYKGSKRTFSELPPSAACVAGDVWNVESEVSRNFYGVKVVSVYAYGMGFDGEGGEMALTDVSAFTVGKTYQVCTEGKKILGTITPTGISGNTLSFTHQTNSDYYGVFCDIAETKDSDYWNTWMEGTAVSINETYYFYSADFASTPPGTDKITKIINEGGTNFAWTGTAWDALGGTVDFSDYYTRTQVDGKIAAAIESALNTEV